jgi:ABC-type glycerol-3-phosphate transport system substrate-binding protein
MSRLRLCTALLALLPVLVLIAGCAFPLTPQAAAPADTPQLLFVHSLGCPHCTNQRPIVEQFTKLYPTVKVTWVEYGKLDAGQRQLIAGTKGHPVLVFHQGGDVRQLVGATALNMLEREFAIFGREQVATPGDSLILGHSGAT